MNKKIEIVGLIGVACVVAYFFKDRLVGIVGGLGNPEAFSGIDDQQEMELAITSNEFGTYGHQKVGDYLHVFEREPHDPSKADWDDVIVRIKDGFINVLYSESTGAPNLFYHGKLIGSTESLEHNKVEIDPAW